MCGILRPTSKSDRLAETNRYLSYHKLEHLDIIGCLPARDRTVLLSPAFVAFKRMATLNMLFD